MKRTTIWIMGAFTAAALAAAGWGAYTAGLRAGAAGVAATAAPAVKAPGARTVLYWHDPMVPGKRFDKPGKSPYMDMELVPVYADEQPADQGIRIAPGLRQDLGVRLASVREGSLASALAVVGNVSVNERERVLVQARSSGFVEKLFVRAPYEPVRRGQPLLELYVPDWVAAQEEYLALLGLGESQATAGLLGAAVQRMRLAGMTEDQVRQVVRRRQVIRRVTVTAPRAGVVTELAAREGMTVSTGAPLFAIAGLETVWVDAQVPEAGAALAGSGTRAIARAAAYPGAEFAGKVETLLPQVDASTRTAAARIELANRDGKLLPGMQVSVSLAPTHARQALLVPSESIIQTGTRSVVIVARDGSFMPVQVQTGREANGETEVLTGLAAGQQVVASGQFLIDSEASLRGTLERLGQGDAAAHEQPPAPTAPGAAPVGEGARAPGQAGAAAMTPAEMAAMAPSPEGAHADHGSHQ